MKKKIYLLKFGHYYLADDNHISFSLKDKKEITFALDEQYARWFTDRKEADKVQNLIGGIVYPFVITFIDGHIEKDEEFEAILQERMHKNDGAMKALKEVEDKEKRDGHES